MLMGCEKFSKKLFLTAGVYFFATAFSSIALAAELSECAAKYIEKKTKMNSPVKAGRTFMLLVNRQRVRKKRPIRA